MPQEYKFDTTGQISDYQINDWLQSDDFKKITTERNYHKNEE